jgi:hypothetical protein
VTLGLCKKVGVTCLVSEFSVLQRRLVNALRVGELEVHDMK